MVKVNESIDYLPNGELDLDAWLSKHYPQKDAVLLRHAYALSRQLSHGLTTFYGRPYLERGLEIANVLLSLKLDQETVATGLIIGAVPQLDETLVSKELGTSAAKLVNGFSKIDMITALQNQKSGDPAQIDKIRKMLLAMATDIRVVLIKLAERLTFMRDIKTLPPADRHPFAQEIMDIYAPLANRLGIGQIKWELEDIAFHYQYPVIYKNIAKFLAERRSDREMRIKQLIHDLQTRLKQAHIQADISGRAKHIYSIYLKMQRKDVNQTEIYDHSAIRVLVPNVQDCYTVLSIVNSLWPPILREFDDYIAHPKSNGYRSIHTAVIGQDGKHFEIQIRTHEMHEESERGVAAHWLYKESARSLGADQTKITYLRQLIDWHQEINAHANMASLPALLNDRVYVITPEGDILDLPYGATPIDFSYYIHSSVGHRCRGAKVNGHIVPLTYTLQTGDKVEIHTIHEGGPSRDWLNSEAGYVKTSRARNRIAHWFKQQAWNTYITEGRDHLERELARHGLAKSTSLIDLAKQLHLKSEEDLFAAIGRGTLKMGHVLHILQPKTTEKILPPVPLSPLQPLQTKNAIVGAAGFLTRYAKCCKPIPGDTIIGYITQSGGISIHKKSCKNIPNLSNPNRFISIDWDTEKTHHYITDLKIRALNQEKALHDLTALFVNEQIRLLSFHANHKKNHDSIVILVTIQIENMTQLEALRYRIAQLPDVIEVIRVKR